MPRASRVKARTTPNACILAHGWQLGGYVAVDPAPSSLVNSRSLSITSFIVTVEATLDHRMYVDHRSIGGVVVFCAPER